MNNSFDGNTWQTWLDTLKELTPTERQKAVEALSPGGKIPQGAPHLIFTAGLGTSGGQGIGETVTSNIETTSEAAGSEVMPSLQVTIQKNMESLGYELD